MTLAVALGALAVALAALALVGVAFSAALSRSDRAGTAAEARAVAEGRLAAAAVEIERAHDAVAEADAAEERQRIRADGLEEEISHHEAYPVLPGDVPVDRAGIVRMRSSLSRTAGVRSARAGRRLGPVALPEPAAAGAAAAGDRPGGERRPSDA